MTSQACSGSKRRLADVSEDPKRVLQNKKRKLVNSEKKSQNRAVAEIPKRYKGGALRLTRTPGRGPVNTVTLGDLIVHPDELCSAFVFSFFIENDLLFQARHHRTARPFFLTPVQFFPFKTNTSPGRPHCLVYVGRDMSLDGVGKAFAKIKTKRPRRADFPRAIEEAQAGYREQYGDNFRAFYPILTGGCAHSKMLVLIYPGFLRFVITSANLMTCDVIDGDNHWFIQDFPRLDPKDAPLYTKTPFEAELSNHLKALGCPVSFRDMYLTSSVFDFSGVKAHLVTSQPGNFSGEKARDYGQLRLCRVVRNKILKYYKKEVPRMTFEVCTGSIGHLENEGVVQNLLASCAGERQEWLEGAPPLKIVFPTLQDVQKSKCLVAEAGNIGSHITWGALEEKEAEYLKTVFHHYKSKDKWRLFHMKLILALHTDAPKEEPPLYMYMGSANFSVAAWGTVHDEGRTSKIGATGEVLRLAGVRNYECGVVVKGGDIAGMLGTDDWSDIVPHVRLTKANRYGEGEHPFRRSKYNTEGALDGEDSDDEGEDDRLEEVMQIVEILCRSTVLRLIGT
ncbi:tyrosyl-DNA phosphodiesterase-domain-containing protein [Mycena maculata]|uniref:Tyrosyl-DNA phosphodiesterase-domain-containing protein n=1 Tax=Mycena maculata TaxID=230809 RepID=A0AAD7J259_9AGAR|nr:tyrosyl-DNA phosphodiesterase-domain-containing protein [Mycena maculata]